MCAALLLLAGAGTAAAAEPEGYVGGGVGTATLKADYDAGGLSASLNEEESAYKIYGGVRFGLLGLEGGYVDLGRPTVEAAGVPVEVHATGFEAFVTLNLSLGDAILFAKGGALNWNAEVELGDFSADENGTSTAWGAGALYRITEHLSVRADYETFETNEFTDLNLWTAGLELRF